MLPPPPSLETALETLTQQRLVMLGREFGVAVSRKASKGEQVRTLARPGVASMPELLRALSRNELKAICKRHEIDDESRSRQDLWDRILQKFGESPAPSPAATADPFVPKANDVVQVRHRQWLVEDVVAPGDHDEQTLVRLVCLDDDNQGRRLEVLWEMELGARIVATELDGIGEVTQLDAPRQWAAYLHALKWNCVSATDGKLFQSPFRAGIQIMNHQLTALKKALELPRVNLFIADDVGLGKTIEAGLVMQELLLRQRADWMLVVVPASVQLQWRDEMQNRFGLHFETYNRQFIQRRRQERGFGVNPWSTHNRFIISYQTLRRPEYRDELLAHLGNRARKSLLVLDEAHTAAPASASKYAVDSNITRVIRDVAPRFEHHLFLSATPHNGHSNSFAALLELLDPQRFTRGVPVDDANQLEPVMVRRLKADLKSFEGIQFPRRRTGEIVLEHDGSRWQQEVRFSETGAPSQKPSAPERNAIGGEQPFELDLARMLASYTDAMKPRRGRGKLVFINLQKRLLSSVAAFHRTLAKHAEAVERHGDLKPPTPHGSRRVEDADEAHGVDDDQIDLEDEGLVTASTHDLETPSHELQKLLDEMLKLSNAYRDQPDAKVRAIVDWVRRNQCDAARLPGDDSRKDTSKSKKAERSWSDTRLILFTEYADTKRFLRRILEDAIEGTDLWEHRIMEFHGGMSDEQREEVQRAFNGSPTKFPVRILIATDAAREGINLQGYCADLIHVDIPWNPARMEQRNGRIDRTLQPADEVRCYYFAFPQRPEDAVLRTLAGKVERIQAELGSMSAVVMDKLSDALKDGISEQTAFALDEAEKADGLSTVKQELETQRKREKIAYEIEAAANILETSKKVVNYENALLKDAIEVGLEMAGTGNLIPVTNDDAGLASDKTLDAYRLPDMPAGWERSLDPLRPPKQRDEAYWEWRERPLLPVTFEPPTVMASDLCQLHLAHPVVRRITSRFLSQGFSAHDLSRVSVVRTEEAVVRVIAFGRLTLFGAGAVRLHDEVVSVAARWLETKGAGHLKPYADAADRKAVETLEETLKAAHQMPSVPQDVQAKLASSAAGDFAKLWPSVKAEAEARAQDAEIALRARGAGEADALKRILASQKARLRKELEGTQLTLFGQPGSESERAQGKQYEQDRKHMQWRLDRIDDEIATQPQELADSYEVVLTRLQPVGMVYLWPKSR